MADENAVEISTDLDLSNLQARLTSAGVRVLREYGGRMLVVARERWTGWKYDGRPADAPRNVSRDAWTMRINTVDGAAEIILTNEARDYRKGKPYVAEVRRSKGAPPEWQLLEADLVERFADDLANALADEVVATIAAPGRRRAVRDARTDLFVTESIDL